MFQISLKPVGIKKKAHLKMLKSVKKKHNKPYKTVCQRNSTQFLSYNNAKDHKIRFIVIQLMNTLCSPDIFLIF